MQYAVFCDYKDTAMKTNRLLLALILSVIPVSSMAAAKMDIWKINLITQKGKNIPFPVYNCNKAYQVCDAVGTFVIQNTSLIVVHVKVDVNQYMGKAHYNKAYDTNCVPERAGQSAYIGYACTIPYSALKAGNHNFIYDAQYANSSPGHNSNGWIGINIITEK